VGTKKMSPEVNCFLFALCKGACFSELQARAAVLRQALCVCKSSLVSAGAPRHDPALPAWGITPGLFRVARCLCFWRAIGQSAQAEQDVCILCSSQMSPSY